MSLWEVEYTDEFEIWWEIQDGGLQAEIDTVIGLLEKLGPQLGFPYSSGVNDSKHSHMRELRIQYKGAPYRILYAFNPQRTALLLLGGCKEGKNRWYEENIAKADKLYDTHLKETKLEGDKNG